MNMDYPFPQKDDILFHYKGDDTFKPWIRERERKFPYIEGYKYAAEMIWKQIEDNHNNLVTEELIHPFVTLQKRSIGIMLKYLISLGCRISHKKFHYDHFNLLELWSDAKLLIGEIGGSDKNDMLAMELMISQLHLLHSASFAFQYTITQNGKKKISGIDWENIKAFKQACEKMAKYLQSGCMHFRTLLEQRDTF